MMNKINNYLSRQSEKYTSGVMAPHTIRLTQVVIYGFLFVNTLLLLPIADQVWSSETCIIGVDLFYRQFPYWILNMLSHPDVEPYYLGFVFAQLFFLLLGILGKWPRFSAIMVYLLTLNLFNKGNELSNGGHHLINLILIYLIFCVPGRATSWVKYKWVRNTAANFGLWAIRVQVALLYLTAGFYKILGDLWGNGEAMYYILSLPDYSLPIVSENILQLDVILPVMSYFVVGYQLAFPIFIWFRRLKPIILTMGVVFHLGIAVVIGIPDFGFIMMASYVAFYSDSQSKKVLYYLAQPARWISQRVRPQKLQEAT